MGERGGWRGELERRSIGPLRGLSALPRWVVLLTVLAVLLAGLSVPGAPGVVLLLLLAAFLAWLLLLSWPTLQPAPRGLRLAVVAALVAVALTRL